MLDAIILAGGKNEGSLKKISSQKYEALIDINGQAMVEYVIKTLEQVSIIDKIIGVGPSRLKSKGINTLVPDQNNLLKNIKWGLQTAKSPYVLLVTSDIPLITVEAIDSFLAQCENIDCAFYYPIIPKNDMQNMFPQAEKTYFKLAEGIFTGGNLFLVNRKVVLKHQEKIKEIIKWRKNPWKLVRMLGPKFIFKYWIRTLSISEVEDRINDLLGYPGRGIILPYPEVGFDVDHINQFKIIKDIYANRKAN
ncbi:molybdopterin-guanine dinucleotide biosynthesis protein A [Halobacteroides halobius DSM 5150]|uniref:Molybdopterin-guanine dinucleotide biosynthesis protein A n=1 Tax=Halobacteroides halobius (strain ATCC 35273 / DSM 5150 / MD-1) TaxID=748449 RepID=L0K7L3_HALHC|nr:nucleotidyltransferase family protein [Halobacteroides halobius]AGB40113.1 molybdopterin-guanine dinucleotide biosynthesis protein A [Halobacteroides halobius DSM 5150]